MDDARRILAQEGEATDGTVLVARHQSAGRGRGEGTQWVDTPGGSLLFTLIRRAEPQVAALYGLAAAAALVRVLDAHCVGALVKWPNDLLIGDRKLAGLLPEYHEAWLLLGMGINVGDGELEGADRLAPTSLADHGVLIELDSLLEQLLSTLNNLVEDGGWHSVVNAHLWRRGQPVVVQMPGGGRRVGRVGSVMRDGCLLIETASGSVTLAAGRLSAAGDGVIP